MAGPGEAATKLQLALFLIENGGAPSDEYIGEGLVDDISFRLARIPNLSLVNQTGAHAGGNSIWNVRQFGLRLGVPFVLLIAIQHEPDSNGDRRLLARCELIRTEDGIREWTATFVHPITEASRIPAEISADLLSVLSLSPSNAERGRIAGRFTNHPAAYNAYVKGVHERNRGAYLSAASEFEQAVSHDPEFSLARLRLANANVSAQITLQDPGHERLERARTAAEEALRLSPHLTEAKWAIGDYYLANQDYRRALDNYLGDAGADTNSAELLFKIAAVQGGAGQIDSAAANMRRVLQLEPSNRRYRRLLVQTLALGHNFREAAQQLDIAADLGSTDPTSQLERVLLELALHGDVDGARLWFQRALGSFSRRELCTAGVSQLNAHLRPALRILIDECVDVLQELSLDSDQSDISNQSIDSAAYHIAKADLFAVFNSLEAERASYDSARVVLEERVARWPDVPAYQRDLGLVLAGLGRGEEAVRHGRLGVVLMPETKCALTAGLQVAAMARIYLMLGQYDAAYDQLTALLSMPSWFSPQLLRLDPTWAPLLDETRFQRLLAGD
jgi:tetratricopeptide (TPR) repeat protein